ncbi:autotransporter [Nocardiopsis aegyptia]|uniref:Autotransporter n=1 Tax=Nocardiopsis aegyptia TaxID=220378 RepID=A0A7Z0EMH4_9ACTN|nr:autotransporter [Nocardiopsis aegyptia]NYJ34835.1 hypothetical protein [Nocardiopsis aegyptia]
MTPRRTGPGLPRALAIATALALLAQPPLLSGTASAASQGDITAEIRAGGDIVLDGEAVVDLPDGETTYDGTISGEGTLTVRGNGTLILTRDSDFTLPESMRGDQTLTTEAGNPPLHGIVNPDPPAVIIEPGATLQYGDGEGPEGVIGHYPYDSHGFPVNALNVRIDGTLRVATKDRAPNLGHIEGSGLLTQPRFLWGGLDLVGAHDFSGVIDNGTGMDFGKPEYSLDIPHVRAVLQQGSSILNPTPRPDHDLVIRADFYERHYGGDINVQRHHDNDGRVVLAGVYSYTDQGPDTDPSLSDPALNWTNFEKSENKRGHNIEGARVQWGDGTTSEIFMPGTAETVYVNLHEKKGHRSELAFDYNGPVTLGAPLGGGVYHDTLAAPGAGDIVIRGTPGNDVTFAAVQHYDGSTTIEENAVLRLGSGEGGGDGGLMEGGDRVEIVNDGALVVQNTETDLTLPPVSGTGSLTQAGPARTTLTGGTAHAGTTTVSDGTLAAGSGALKSGAGVLLTGADAVLDLRRAGGDAVLPALSAVEGARVLLGDGTSLSVGGDTAATADLDSDETVEIDGVAYEVSAAEDGDTALVSTGEGAEAAGTAAQDEAEKAVGTDTAADGTDRADGDLASTGFGPGLLWTLVLGAAALALGAVAFVVARRRGHGRATAFSPRGTHGARRS